MQNQFMDTHFPSYGRRQQTQLMAIRNPNIPLGLLTKIKEKNELKKKREWKLKVHTPEIWDNWAEIT